MSNGFLNSVYAIETDTGHYIFRVLEESEASFMFADHAERWKAQQHLFANGAPVPEPVATSMLGGKTVLVERRVPGINATQHPTPEEAYRMGEALAHFHLAGRDMPAFNHHLPSIGALVGHEIIESIKRLNRGDIASEWAFWRSGLAVIPDRIRKARHEQRHLLTEGMIHGDLNPDNWIITGKDVSLIDFDSLQKGAISDDIAQMLYHFGFSKNEGTSSYGVHATIASALLEGYQTIAPISIEDQCYLPIALKEYARLFLAGYHRLRLEGKDAGTYIEPKSAAVIDFCNRGDVSALFPNTTHEAPTPDAAAKGWLPTLRDAVPFLRDRERHAA